MILNSTSKKHMNIHCKISARQMPYPSKDYIQKIDYAISLLVMLLMR